MRLFLWLRFLSLSWLGLGRGSLSTIIEVIAEQVSLLSKSCCFIDFSLGGLSFGGLGLLGSFLGKSSSNSGIIVEIFIEE